ncbi:fumarylacetoacetase [Viridothelium virens]|uniref:Fumarylacetoacetase n=1 Tax=Viridothelium virens TaxID=1048519 RepID=A0A6A6GWJ6_VIRVR|nr:fumarylacetoacetase [Viridothelium virens]
MPSEYAHHFGINNIPYGIASSSKHPPSVVTRLQDSVLFLDPLARTGLLSGHFGGEVLETFGKPTLNSLATLPKDDLKVLRSALQGILKNLEKLQGCVEPIENVRMHLPVEVGDFTDFSCSADHMLNAGESVTGLRNLPPSFRYLPVGYISRASGVKVSGTPFHRPWGQYRKDGSVVWAPTEQLDYELEMACIIGKPSKFGTRVKVEDTAEHIFGIVILNDWSARDIQSLEMPPLGPMNSKSFCTSVSPWVINPEALAPFRSTGNVPAREEPPNGVMTHFSGPGREGYSVDLTASVVSPKDKDSKTILCRSNLSTMYWTFEDLIAHQTCNGAFLRTGDILATGTVTGKEKKTSHGCLLELTAGGKQSYGLNNGETRTYLEDGDSVILDGISGEGVGFGDCTGTVLPAQKD